MADIAVTHPQTRRKESCRIPHIQLFSTYIYYICICFFFTFPYVIVWIHLGSKITWLSLQSWLGLKHNAFMTVLTQMHHIHFRSQRTPTELYKCLQIALQCGVCESWANCCSSSKNASSGASCLKREGHIGQFANQIYSILSQVLVWNCLTWVRQEVSSSEAWFLDIESYCANLKWLRYWPRLLNGGKWGLSCLLHLFLGLTPALRLCTLLMQDSRSDTFI